MACGCDLRFKRADAQFGIAGSGLSNSVKIKKEIKR